MLYINNYGKAKQLNSQFWLMVFTLIIPVTVIAESSDIVVDFNAMMNALKNAAPILNQLAFATAYVVGFWFIISAIMELKQIGQSSTMQSQGALGKPIVKLICGVLLMYFPSTVSVGIASLWKDSQILTWTPTSSDPFAPAKAGAIALVQVVGYVAFIRGLIMLAHSSDQGSQQGGVGKALMHIIGGVFAINIVATINLVQQTLGISVT